MKNQSRIVVTAMAISLFSATTWCQEPLQPIYVSFFTHYESAPVRGIPDTIQYRWDYSGDGPAPHSVIARDAVELFEKHNFKAEMCLTPVALQMLADDFPETIEKMKKLKVPVTRYPSVPGHNQPAPVARFNDIPGIENMTEDELIRLNWQYESRMLIPNWHFEQKAIVRGNPVAGKQFTLDILPQYHLKKIDRWLYSGTLAFQKILGVTPMMLFPPVFEGQAARQPSPIQQLMGVGSFESSHLPSLDFVSVPSGTGTPLERVKFVAAHAPLNKPVYMGIGMMQLDSITTRKETEELIVYLKQHPKDFKIVWSDPESIQWKPENSPLEFYKKTYGVNSLEDVLNMEPPVDRIKAIASREPAPTAVELNPLPYRKTSNEPKDAGLLSKEEVAQRSRWLQTEWNLLFNAWRGRELPQHLRPTSRTLAKADIFKAAEFFMERWPSGAHHGGAGFSGVPDFVDLGAEKWSLADTFQAFCFALEHYSQKNAFPESVEVQDILGPVDYPMYRLKEEPKLNPGIQRGEWAPIQLPEEYLPEPEQVELQGIRGSGFVNEANLFQAVYRVAPEIRRKGMIPGTTPIYVNSNYHDASSPFHPNATEMHANAAEMLFSMAMQVWNIAASGRPTVVVMNSTKIVPDQVTEFITPAGPPMVTNSASRYGQFLWRSEVPVWRINATWTYRP